jgi:hypothetical protein
MRSNKLENIFSILSNENYKNKFHSFWRSLTSPDNKNEIPILNSFANNNSISFLDYLINNINNFSFTFVDKRFRKQHKAMIVLLTLCNKVILKQNFCVTYSEIEQVAIDFQSLMPEYILEPPYGKAFIENLIYFLRHTSHPPAFQNTSFFPIVYKISTAGKVLCFVFECFNNMAIQDELFFDHRHCFLNLEKETLQVFRQTPDFVKNLLSKKLNQNNLPKFSTRIRISPIDNNQIVSKDLPDIIGDTSMSGSLAVGLANSLLERKNDARTISSFTIFKEGKLSNKKKNCLKVGNIEKKVELAYLANFRTFIMSSDNDENLQKKVERYNIRILRLETITKALNYTYEVIPGLIGKQRHFQADFKIIGKSKNEILILGINSLGILHRIERIISKLISRGVIVKILLLDPSSKHFLQRMKDEENIKKNKTKKISNRLLSESKASLGTCARIATITDFNERLQIRLYNDYPKYAMVAVDVDSPNVKMNVNYYPDKPGSRGFEGIHRQINVEEDEFKYFLRYFYQLWDKSIQADIEPYLIDI